MSGLGAGNPVSGSGTWRLVLDGCHCATWNMAVDEAILDAVAAGISPPTVRMYGWEQASVTAGRHQNVAATVQVDACRSAGIPIVRRPTGGRGVLHGGDITVTIVVPVANLGSAGASVVTSYRMLSAGLVAGLARLGVVVIPGTCERRRDRGGDCFASVSAADVVLASGEKLIGSAQCRREGVILQQSSVRHRPPTADCLTVFKGDTGMAAYPLKERSTRELETALTWGIEEMLRVRLNPGALTMWEEERTCVLMSHPPSQRESVTSHAG